ncbi:MAG TPA: ferrochelatase [Mucilaginibacter sp.]
MYKKGILLVNLGTPDSSSTADVRKYLKEFLMDERVIDIHPLLRSLLVKGIIVPFRGPKSAKLYKKIWSEESGSPLLQYSYIQQRLLQQKLGVDYQVELGMRYQKPSIEKALNRFKANGVEHITIIPLFPQYASATTGSVYQEVMRLLSTWPVMPGLSFINSFHDNALMIDAFAENGKDFEPHRYDHVLFSFHGVPKRHLRKAGCNDLHVHRQSDCCKALTGQNKFCYAAQCYDTARLIASKLNLPTSKYSVSFQSRLGNDPWLEPYTTRVLTELAKAGKKRVLVFCPAFVADCLETIYEIKEEGLELFVNAGGKELDLVPSLNDSPIWIEALAELATRNSSQAESGDFVKTRT